MSTKALDKLLRVMASEHNTNLVSYVLLEQEMKGRLATTDPLFPSSETAAASLPPVEIPLLDNVLPPSPISPPPRNPFARTVTPPFPPLV